MSKLKNAELEEKSLLVAEKILNELSVFIDENNISDINNIRKINKMVKAYNTLKPYF